MAELEEKIGSLEIAKKELENQVSLSPIPSIACYVLTGERFGMSVRDRSWRDATRWR